MKELSNLIFNAFGIGFSISELSDRTGLPRYLSSGREIIFDNLGINSDMQTEVAALREIYVRV